MYIEEMYIEERPYLIDHKVTLKLCGVTYDEMRCLRKAYSNSARQLPLDIYRYALNDVATLNSIYGMQSYNRYLKPKKVIFHDPATIVFWTDGSKTVVKCQEGDTYNKEMGFALCCAKRLFGNQSNFNNIFKKFVED